MQAIGLNWMLAVVPESDNQHQAKKRAPAGGAGTCESRDSERESPVLLILTESPRLAKWQADIGTKIFSQLRCQRRLQLLCRSHWRGIYLLHPPYFQ